jgi:hypothetical protein
MMQIDAIDLVTMSGFTATFWQLYREGGRSQEAVYDILDEIYYARFGEHRFVSFDAFRMRRNRETRKKRRLKV